MNKINLNDIAVPAELPQLVEGAMSKARSEERGTVGRTGERATSSYGAQRAHQKRRTSPWRYRVAAAAVVVAVGALLFNFSAVAGAVGQAFTAFQDSVLQTPSRDALVANGFPKDSTGALGAVSESNGYTLALDSYYLDDTEIGFEFTLTGDDLPEFAKLDDCWLMFDRLSLEVTGGSTPARVWESSYDRAADIDTRTFPGGYYLEDRTANRYEYEPGDGQDFIPDFLVKPIDANTYKVAGVITFRKPVAVGTHIDLHLGDMVFLNVVGNECDNSAPEPAIRTGDWSFAIDVDERFVNAQTLRYEVLDPDALAAKGIVITGIAVSPSGCRIEASIDYAQNALVDPATATGASEPQYAPKLQVMSTIVEMEADGRLYANHTSGYYPANASVGANTTSTDCYFIFDSMYFDDATNLTLRFYEQDGTIIEVAVAPIKR